ncbi:G-PROTEIN-RECEP-F1-2 domain-containing protein [Aphelenchoides bicaudatus]|nr:G-PROTEIN-RECEP-F1-2 domain-containing protein [Aphelenchoides bicaudatus]
MPDEPGDLLFKSEGLVDNITDDEYADMMNNDGDFHLLAFVYMAIMPISCIIGLTGNCLVFILIRSNQIFRRLPSSPYLLGLSICSTMFLVSVFTFWMEQSFFKDPHEQHSTLVCKLSTFFAHFSDFTSVWLIVLVGYERLVLLYKATRFQRSLTNSRRQVIVLVFLSIVANFWILFVAESTFDGYCGVRVDYEHVYNIFMLIETILNMAVPSVLIVGSNILVILKLRDHLKRIPASTVSFNTNDIVYSGDPTQTIKLSKTSKASLYRLSSRLSMNKMDEIQALRYKRHSLRYADLQLSRSLAIMTSFFISLNLPNYLYRIASVLQLNIQPEVMQNISFLALTLLYLHHALLFFVYIFNSPQMRKRLLPTALKLLECYCLKTVQESDFNY